MSSYVRSRHGAFVTDRGVQFRLWSPRARSVTLALEDGEDRAMTAQPDGWFALHADGLEAGARYCYHLNGGPPLPDPASRFQPEGVHGPSEVIDPSAYSWKDDGWTGVARDDLVIYELHVGAFSPEGTFDGVRRRLDALMDLGVTALELMPVADWPGRWNWGYDPAAPFAPARAYGRPDDLRALVDAAHQRGLAVLLDVIHNHLGPDGAYAAAVMPFLTEAHQTPWGDAVNLDDTHSDGVRAFLIDNALHWLEEYHVDGFRLDAVHALRDASETHFLAELAEAVATVDGPPRHLIAEDYRNDHVLVLPRDEGGYGLDAMWTDDPHHILRHLLTGDRTGIFTPFAGTATPELAEALAQGWYYDGKPSHATGIPFGTSTDPVDPAQVVIYLQNHDQVGNRPAGRRLHHDVPLSVYRAASALLLLAPEVPLLFMGQEWATTAPFLFFSDHHDELGRRIREGRQRLFDDWTPVPTALPDPQDPDTFTRCRLPWEERDDAPHAQTLALYRDLLHWRRQLDGPATTTAHDTHSLTLTRGPFSLLVTLADGNTLPLPHDAEILMHTEEPEYAPDSCPPEVGNHAVYFPVAGAMLVTTG